MQACHRLTVLALLGALMFLATGGAFAQDGDTATFRVTITNLTHNQIFSPPVAASHSQRTRVFRLGQPADPEVAAVAEDADAAGLVALLGTDPEVLDVVTGDGVIMPGQTASFEIRASYRFSVLSLVGMLVTTNDAFYGVDSLSLSNTKRVNRFTVPAYDAGSEANNESCASIPGPPCGNGGVRATAGAEGYIHVHRGIHGIGDLPSIGYDWRNPVARISVIREGI